MLRGEIEVWEKGDYRPFSRFFEIRSDNKIRESDLSGVGTRSEEKNLKCRLRSESSHHLMCVVDLKENANPNVNPREIIFFEFKNLPKKGRTRVQGTNFLGQFTSWVCTFTAPS